MKIVKEIFGYLLGGILFVALIPSIMWIVSGRPALIPSEVLRLVAGAVFALFGLALSVWSIVHMRNKGNGNPMDAFGHEVAPRTQHLMTDGPYRLSRNPMLTGTFLYLIGICLWLWTWQAVAVFVIFVVIMLVQVRTEENRLRRDFGEEYEAYCRRTGRFLPF
ncbi:MAG: isoprenylcysteine carboxylmethyltransferase family protein [Paludibacteraceae bacterium]|nr:isoprenylcysteine carboxylmethyltransferase family protein [Paludibacteraceae bacterium]